MKILLLLALAFAMTCAEDEPMFKAKVNVKGKDIWALLNTKFTFNLQYDQKEPGKNDTKKAVNSKFNVPKGAKTQLVAEAGVAGLFEFSLLWGNDPDDSGLTFNVELVDNKTMISNVSLSAALTKANGFVNASGDKRTYHFAPGLAWPTADAFKCQSTLSVNAVAKEDPSNMTLSATHIQVGASETFSKNDSVCSEDTKTTTPKPTPSTTPTPAPLVVYGVQDKKTKFFCLLLDAAITFKISYEAVEAKNKTATKTLHLEVPKSAKVNDMKSTCGAKPMGEEKKENVTAVEERLVISFNKTWELTLVVSQEGFYTSKADGASFTVIYMALSGNLDPSANASNPNFNLESAFNRTQGNFIKGLLLGPLNKTLTCNKYSEDLADSKGKIKITTYFSDIKFQAFTEAMNHTAFSKSTSECPVSKAASDTIPIVVGASLAALVLLVLVAYLIGRARARRGGYQSV